MLKMQNDKTLWEWTYDVKNSSDIKDEHLEKVYHLDMDLCHNKINKNCRNNPRCLNGLGEKNVLASPEDALTDVDDPNSERRQNGSFVGLKNLGATCYVNSLLQVWYHNPVLRHAIYQWNPDEDDDEIKGFTKEINENVATLEYSPKSPVGNLQLIFAKMQFGVKCFVDPTPFVKCLNINESLQQDAYEFCILFVSLLEKKMSIQRNLSIKNIIEKQYCGTYAYVTKCQRCNDGSNRESKFYDLALNIKGCKDIHDCLKDFLKEERLEGNDQYDCLRCKSKQIAIRSIKLQTLPPILNLQLLRFVYDRQRGGKKKLNSFLKFPDTLEMSNYISDSSVNCDKSSLTYYLSAVLIHRGPSAHSGHYIAHIKDRNGFWYKFNDEKVEKIEKLKLEPEECSEPNATNNGNEKVKDTKGWHNSNNAYMLVYKNDRPNDVNTFQDNYDDWSVPEYLRNAIDRSNNTFEELVSDLLKIRESTLCENKERRIEVRNIYEKLPVPLKEPYELISKKWLMNWLSSVDSTATQVSRVDNSHILCSHGNLDLKAISHTKCISLTGAEMIYSKYEGGPRITKNSLCRMCVVYEIKMMRLKKELDYDQKEITGHLKFTLSPDDNGYWIGKDSLRNWKQNILSSFENTNENCRGDNCDVLVQNIGNMQINYKAEHSFNSDIVCAHGRLSPDASSRRLISTIVWNILKKYFPNSLEFQKDHNVCANCVSFQEELKNAKDLNRSVAAQQKLLLHDLCNERRRFGWDDLVCGTIYYALSRKFLREWQRFVNEPTKNDPPSSIDNSMLICEHEKFLYPLLQSELIGDRSRFVIITENEWESLCTNYQFDKSIMIYLEESTNNYISVPSYCASCHSNLQLQEKRERLTYSDQFIYVRKIQNKIPNQNDDCSIEIVNDKHDDTSDVIYEATNCKRRKKVEESLCCDSGLRRSSRRRKHKDEKEIKVSSTDTLKDLKVHIMKIFKVATYDQHLSLDDVSLEGNDKTLAQLNITPESIISLVVDEEPTSEFTIMEDDYIKGSVPEVGFKGTQLQYH